MTPELYASLELSPGILGAEQMIRIYLGTFSCGATDGVVPGEQMTRLKAWLTIVR